MRQPDTGELVDLDEGPETLHRHRPEGLHMDVPLGKPERLERKEDGSRPGDLLHAPRKVCRLPDRGVVHAQVTADRPYDHLPRVEPDSDLDRGIPLAPDLLAVSSDRLLHPERGVARTNRMILVREGGAEQSHDAVAHHLIHGAFVAMDGLHHSLEDGVEDLSGLFGVAIGQQFHGSLHVGEHHRHLLALTFQGRPGRQDLVHQILRHVRLGRGKSRPGDDGYRGRMATMRAEPGRGQQPGIAVRAAQLKLRAAINAELGLGIILVMTAGASHAVTSPGDRGCERLNVQTGPDLCRCEAATPRPA